MTDYSILATLEVGTRVFARVAIEDRIEIIALGQNGDEGPTLEEMAAAAREFEQVELAVAWDKAKAHIHKFPHHGVQDSVPSVPEIPPRLAEFLFSLLAPKKTLDAQLGDMQELFEQRTKLLGVSRARLLYWSQVLRAIRPSVWRFVRKWGLIGFLIDYGRSKLGL